MLATLWAGPVGVRLTLKVFSALKLPSAVLDGCLLIRRSLLSRYSSTTRASWFVFCRQTVPVRVGLTVVWAGFSFQSTDASVWGAAPGTQSSCVRSWPAN